MKWIFSLFLIGLAACSQQGSLSSASDVLPDPQDQIASTNDVVKARAVIQVAPGSTAADDHDPLEALAATTLPVDFVSAPNTNVKFSTAKFKVPTITNAILKFGSLSVTAFSDNVLNVCGANNKTQCSKAFIRIYTTGAPGPGLWNVDAAYGMPITATVGAKGALVGLDADHAAYMVAISIPPEKHALSMTDLASAKVYNITADFKAAGAGHYSTNLVIEYGLAD